MQQGSALLHISPHGNETSLFFFCFSFTQQPPCWLGDCRKVASTIECGPRWRETPDRRMAVPQPSREMSLNGEGPPDGRQVANCARGKGEVRGKWGRGGPFCPHHIWRGHTPSNYKFNTPPCPLLHKTLLLFVSTAGEG